MGARVDFTFVVISEEGCSATGAATVRTTFKAWCVELPYFTMTVGDTEEVALKAAQELVTKLCNGADGRKLLRIQKWTATSD